MSKAKWVSVSDDGAAWSVWDDGGLYKRVGNGWEKNTFAANVAEVTVGWEVSVWHSNTSGELYVADNPQDVNTGWRQVDLGGQRVKSIAAAHDGSCWVVTQQGTLLKRKGPPFGNTFGFEKPSAPVEKAMLVSTGGDDKVVYVDSGGNIFEQFDDQASGTKGWRPLGTHPAFQGTKQPVKSISVTGAGDMWAADWNDRLYKRGKSSPFDWSLNESGMAVQIATGQLKAGGEKHVWCVNKDGELFRGSSGNANTAWDKIALTPSTVPPGGSLYTVRKGDTLGGIIAAKCPSVSGAKLNEMIAEVARMNGIANPDRIDAGLVLKLPPCP